MTLSGGPDQVMGLKTPGRAKRALAHTPLAERKTGFWPPLGMWPLGQPWRPPPPSAHGAHIRYITRMAPFVTRAAKGAWEVPTSAPVYLRHVHLPGARLTTHARKQQEAHLRAPKPLWRDPPCPRRARPDQNTRAWRTWSLPWGTEMRKWSWKTWMRRKKSNMDNVRST